MPKSYPNVFEALNSTVWAITNDKFDEISALVQTFADRGPAERAAMLGSVDDQPEPVVLGAMGNLEKVDAFYADQGVKMQGGIAVVPVRGTVMKRMNMFSNFSGGVSTEMLSATMRVLANDDRVTGAVLDIDSPGGSVEGMTEVVSSIKALRDAKGDGMVKAVANDMMASAAYWIGSSVGPGNLYATNDAMVGSIGVVSSRWDYSKAYEDKGVKQHVWRSGDYKALGQEGEAVSEKENKERDRMVRAYYNNFVEALSTNRFGGDKDKAAAIADGRVFVGSEAITNQMADAIKTVAETVADLQADASAEDRYQAVHTLAVSQEGVIASLQTDKAALEAQIADLQTAREADAKAAVEAKATDFIAGLVTEGKVAAVLSDTQSKEYADFHASLVANFDAVSAPFAFVPAGAAAPKAMDEPVADVDAEGTLAKTLAQAEAKAIPVAEDADMAEVFVEMGYREVSGDISALTEEEKKNTFVRGFRD